MAIITEEESLVTIITEKEKPGGNHRRGRELNAIITEKDMSGGNHHR